MGFGRHRTWCHANSARARGTLASGCDARSAVRADSVALHKDEHGFGPRAAEVFVGSWLSMASREMQARMSGFSLVVRSKKRLWIRGAARNELNRYLLMPVYTTTRVLFRSVFTSSYHPCLLFIPVWTTSEGLEPRASCSLCPT